MKSKLILIASLFGLFSCVDNKEASRRTYAGQSPAQQTANVENLPSFDLSWNAVPEAVTAYHIYYTSDGTNSDGVEINSLMPSSPNFKTPKITISTKEIALNEKKQACFYIVADNEGAMSLPSDAVCSAAQ